MQKTLVLIRHAHRDNTQRELDNGLSEKGRDQAKAVKRFFTERFSKEEAGKGLWLVSSPKLRCVETLQPIAKGIERPVDIHPGLDEQGSRESIKAFEGRVQAFLHEWAESKMEITILCSHGDWLPAAALGLLGLHQEFKKGSWLELESDGSAPLLRWYVPTFKHFFK
jgi:broad specificity phosphatase PhoE